MSDHFTLDVSPDDLQSVKQWLRSLSSHLASKGAAVAATPGDIGQQWTGDAAASIKGEMTGLGRLMKGRLAPELDALAGAVGALEREYRQALERLPGLNRRWREAEEAYENAIDRANRAYEQSTDGQQLSSFERHEHGEVRRHAATSAQSTRRSAQDALQLQFDELRATLERRTRDLNAALVDHTPLQVPEPALEDLRSGRHPEAPTDFGTLLSGMAVTSEYVRAQEAAYHEKKREEAGAQVEDDLEDLREALEDGDAEAINRALAAIGSKQGDPYYPDVLVDVLGPDGVLQLYDDVERAVADGQTSVEEVQAAMLDFNDTVAAGIEAKDDEELAEFVDGFFENGYAARMWALIAASDKAKGRINATAMAYSGQVYDNPYAGIGRPTLVPHLYHYAYDLDEVDSLLEQWDERSSGSDLSRVFSHSDSEQRQELLSNLLDINTDGGTLNDEEWERLANTYGEMLLQLEDDFLAAHERSEGAEPELLMEALEHRHFPHDPLYWEAYSRHLDTLVHDPEFASWYLGRSSWDSEHYPASTFKDLIRDAGTTPDSVMTALLSQHTRNANAEGLAGDVGLLLRYGDILGEDDIEWGKVVTAVGKSILDDAIGELAKKNPVVGPAKAALEALWAEHQRVEQMDKDLDDALDQNAANQQWAFYIYVADNGRLPPGYAEYVEENALGENSNAINLYYQHLREDGGPAWDELQDYFNEIHRSRNEGR